MWEFWEISNSNFCNLCFCWKRESEQSEVGPKVKALKGKGKASKTGKTRPCNYCVVKRKVLLDCSLFSCLLCEAKARGVRENHTLLVTGAVWLLPHTHMHAWLPRKNGSCLTPALFITMKWACNLSSTTNQCSFKLVMMENLVISPQ